MVVLTLNICTIGLPVIQVVMIVPGCRQTGDTFFLPHKFLNESYVYSYVFRDFSGSALVEAIFTASSISFTSLFINFAM
jgi:hypothetical protein